MPKTKKTSKRKPNPAFMKPVQPDDKLSAVVGSTPLSRPELTKKLWAYIKPGVAARAVAGLKDNSCPGRCVVPLLRRAATASNMVE